jgi:hypothetical protein
VSGVLLVPWSGVLIEQLHGQANKRSFRAPPGWDSTSSRPSVACAGPDLQQGSRMVDQFVLPKHLSDCGMKTCATVLLQLYRSNRGFVGDAPVGVQALAER